MNLTPWHPVGAHGHGAWNLCVASIIIGISLSDIMWRKVRNELVLVGLVIASCWTLMHGGPLGWAWGAGRFFVGGATLLVPYALGRMGAADVKVFALYAMLAGPGALIQFSLFSAIFAGILGLVALWQDVRGSLLAMFLRVMRPRQAFELARARGSTIPLTVALSGGLALSLLRGIA